MTRGLYLGETLGSEEPQKKANIRPFHPSREQTTARGSSSSFARCESSEWRRRGSRNSCWNSKRLKESFEASYRGAVPSRKSAGVKW